MCVISVHVSICVARDDGDTKRTGHDIAEVQSDIDIRLTKNLVSVNIVNAGMRNVLEKLSTLSGIKLWISDDVQPEQITAHFESQPMEEALRQLLSSCSYALICDDNASVTSLSVLPPGEAAPTNVKLIPGDNNIVSQVLIAALESNSVPDSVKAALLNQSSAELQQTIMAQRTQAIYKLFEHIKEVGSADPMTAHQLLEKLELQKILKQK